MFITITITFDLSSYFYYRKFISSCNVSYLHNIFINVTKLIIYKTRLILLHLRKWSFDLLSLNAVDMSILRRKPRKWQVLQVSNWDLILILIYFKSLFLWIKMSVIIFYLHNNVGIYIIFKSHIFPHPLMKNNYNWWMNFFIIFFLRKYISLQ